MRRTIRLVGCGFLVFSQILTLSVLLHQRVLTIPGIPAEVEASLFPGLLKIFPGPPTLVTWPVYMAVVCAWALGMVFLVQAWGALDRQARREAEGSTS